MWLLRAAPVLLILAATFVLPVAAEEYWIKVTPTATRGFEVQTRIETNIPGSMVLAVRLLLADQGPDDNFVGTGQIRVPLSGGKATVTIEGEKKVIPHGYPLPDGTYEIEVVFSHLWPGNTEVTRATGLQTNIKGAATVELPDGDDNPADQFDSAEATRWVMENVYRGYHWNPAFWRNKYGEIEELEYRGTGDAKALKIFYVRSINMSLLVDIQKNQILKYHMGVVHE